MCLCVTSFKATVHPFNFTTLQSNFFATADEPGRGEALGEEVGHEEITAIFSQAFWEAAMIMSALVVMSAPHNTCKLLSIDANCVRGCVTAAAAAATHDDALL